jgi:mono/diheme cytochrome c family protein
MLRLVRRLAPLSLALPVLAMTAGGWAVATVDSLPDHLVAARPTELAFTVRQHGVTALDGLRPVIEATSGATRARFEATASGLPGRYRATLVPPTAGEWTLVLRHGFGNGSVTLPPIEAMRAGASPAALPAAERGRRLFAAKGCVTCHVDIQNGPNLTGRRYDAGWLARFLADPQRVRPAPVGKPTMPTLGLDGREIAALVAFVNGGQVVAR